MMELLLGKAEYCVPLHKDKYIPISGVCECYLIWQWGVKVADGIKGAHQLTLK